MATLTEAAKQVVQANDPGRKFQAPDVTPELRQAALAYLVEWEGDFSFLVDMKATLRERTLSDGQIKGVLNCVRAQIWRDQKAESSKGSTSIADIPEGIHYLDGTYYKVQVAKSGSGNKYAKVWDGSWNYERGAISRLSEDTKVSAEQAAEFGKLYGVCVFCARDLTDERSIAVGYGPTCASNNDLPWGEIFEGENATV